MPEKIQVSAARLQRTKFGLTDLSLAAGSAVLSGDLEETVGIDLEGGDQLCLTARSREDASELELAEKTVVLALSAFTLINGEGDSRLIVFDSCERTALVGWDGGVARHDDTKDVTLHGDTEGEGSNIKEKEVLGLVRSLTSENGGLNSGTVGNSLIRVDGLVQLAATEELRDHRLDLGDTSGTANEDDVVNLLAGHLGILENLLNGLHC